MSDETRKTELTDDALDQVSGGIQFVIKTDPPKDTAEEEPGRDGGQISATIPVP